jgi:tetratricopeptide (TPR) repeat protein
MWLDLLEQDHDNIRSALEWAVDSGESDLAFRMAAGAWRLWQARGHLHEAHRRLDEVLALEGGEPKNRAKALEALGGILWWQSDVDGVTRVYEETLEMQRLLGEPREIANALYNYSLTFVFGGNRDGAAASRALDEAEAIYRQLGDIGGLGDIEWGWGNVVAYVDDDLPRAIEHMKQSIDFYQQAGNEFGMGWGLFEVGDMERRVGDYEAAWPYISRGLRLFADHRDVSGVVLLLAAAAALAGELGYPGRAHRLAGAFHSLRITSGTDIVRNDLNQVDGLEYETLESLSGEEAIPYREGMAMSLEDAVDYALTGPTDG